MLVACASACANVQVLVATASGFIAFVFILNYLCKSKSANVILTFVSRARRLQLRMEDTLVGGVEKQLFYRSFVVHINVIF